MTHNCSCYRAASFRQAVGSSRTSRSRPNTPYTPRHNGKVERYNRILAEEPLRTHIDLRKPSARPSPVGNVLASYN